MGMDVFGQNPKNKKGEYFRNNVWWWRPLWEYCEFVAPELTDMVEHGYSNDGDGLDGDDARKLGNALRKALRKGETAEYIAKRQEFIDNLPIIPCPHCEATGTRKWLKDVVNGDTKPAVTYDIMETLSNEMNHTGSLPTYTYHEPETGWVMEERECNACAGVGGTKSWEHNYPMDENNVREFATFLVNCGGFSIC